MLELVDAFSQPGNEMKALREIRHVLRPSGQLLIYQMPADCARRPRLQIAFAQPSRWCIRNHRRCSLISL
ncbi:MAG: hypothetical protein KIH69_001515 [Anaerolineae bacterium]|nr:hypothetical protein [Anaerolineae bacterium]